MPVPTSFHSNFIPIPILYSLYSLYPPAIIDPAVTSQPLELGDDKIDAGIDVSDIQEVRHYSGHSKHMREICATFKPVLECEESQSLQRKSMCY